MAAIFYFQLDLWAFDVQVGFQHVDFTITSVTKNVPYKFGLWITQVFRWIITSSILIKLTNDHSWVRLTATTGRQWWQQGAAPSFTLASRESSSRSTLKVSSTSTTKTTTAASGHNHFWNLTWNIVLVRSERGSCYVEFQTDANHFMLEPVSTKRGGGAQSKSHLSEKAKADICEEL